MNDTLLYLGGVATVVVVVALLVASAVYLTYRAKKETSATEAGKSLAKGAADTVKKAIAEKPPWLMTPLVVGGGWLFLIFSIYVLLPPSVWQWLLGEHQEFLWMPPLVAIVVQMLLASKKGPAKHLAYAIIFVFAIALVKAIPWGGSGKSDMAPPRPAEMAPARYASISTPLSWAGCEPLPSRIPARIGSAVSQTLYAPVGVESRCYIIRDGYRSRMAPQAPLRMRWQNGTVLNLSPDPTKMTNLGTVWYAAFVISSNGDTPAKLIMRFEKYAQ